MKSVPEFLEVGDIARRADCSPDLIKKLSDAGRLPLAGRTRRGSRLFTMETAEALKRQREQARRG